LRDTNTTGSGLGLAGIGKNPSQTPFFGPPPAGISISHDRERAERKGREGGREGGKGRKKEEKKRWEKKSYLDFILEILDCHFREVIAPVKIN
jgi:hypothetical protein